MKIIDAKEIHRVKNHLYSKIIYSQKAKTMETSYSKNIRIQQII